MACVVLVAVLGSASTSTAAAASPSSTLEAEASAHPCVEDPRSGACAAACSPDVNDRACVEVCRNFRGVGWCRAWCEAHPDRSCPGYRAPPACPEFEGPLWRLGLRALAEAQILDPFGATAGLEVAVGARIHPEWSVIADVGGGFLGIDTQGNYLPSIGGGVGVERLDFDRLAPMSALGLTAQVGLWLTRRCRAGADCPLALPYAEVGARFLALGDGGDPYYRPFFGRSLGIDLGLGYDPWLERWLGRVAITAGFELAFR